MTEAERPFDWKDGKGSRKSRTFADPNPGEVFVSTISETTEAEQAILEKFSFDKVSIGGNAYMLAGFIARDTVGLAKYMRSIDEYPEKTDHFERLIGIAERSPNGWIRHYTEWPHPSGEVGSDIVDQAIDIIETADWSDCDLKPVFDADRREICFEAPEPAEQEVA